MPLVIGVTALVVAAIAVSAFLVILLKRGGGGKVLPFGFKIPGAAQTVSGTVSDFATQSLIYLPFDDGFDNVADGTAATVHGNVELGSGVSGNAAHFDGDTGYLDLGTGYNLTGSFALNMWLKPDKDNADRSDAGVFAKYETNGRGPYDFYLQYNAPALWISSGSVGSWYVADHAISSNEWNMVTYVFDAADKKLTIYVDGKLVLSEEGLPEINANNDVVTVGRQALLFSGSSSSGHLIDTDAHLKYQGWVDDLLLLPRTLGESDIRRLYDEGSAGLS